MSNQSPLKGSVDLTSLSLVDKCICVKHDRAVKGKTIVLGFIKRHSKVHIEIKPDFSVTVLQ